MNALRPVAIVIFGMWAAAAPVGAVQASQTPRADAPRTPPADTQPSTPSPAPRPGAAPSAATTPIEPAGFTYSAEGRRDPFVSLLRRGRDARGASTAARPVGLPGLAVGEVTLRGTVRSREGFVAIVQGADQKTYIVRAGDRLFDGTVRTITQNDMVILQQVNDPLSLEKQREVRKILRQTEAN